MHTALLAMDYRLFTMLNSLAGRSDVGDFVIRFFAQAIIFLMFAGLVLFITAKKEPIRYRGAIESLASVLLGRLIFVILIRLFFIRLRPFVDFTVHQLIQINPLQPAYPSVHATIMFAIAFSIFLRNRRWGVMYLALALLSSIARVIAGVHFPLDIFGGMLLGIMSSLVVWLVSEETRKRRARTRS